MEQNSPFFKIGTRECGMLCAALGALLALSLILFGFWSTLLIAALAAVGFFIGASKNKLNLCKTVINRLFPPKGE